MSNEVNSLAELTIHFDKEIEGIKEDRRKLQMREYNLDNLRVQLETLAKKSAAITVDAVEESK